MKLYSSSTSPYVRKVRVVAREAEVEKKIEEIITDPWTNEDLRKLNPLRKVPTLVLNDGSILFDSRVIAEYLADEGGSKMFGKSMWGDAKWRYRALGLHALGDGLCDAAVSTVVENRNPPEARNQGNLVRFRMAIDAALDTLEKFAPKLMQEEPSIGEIAIGVALGYLDFRFTDLDWRKGHPNLAAWYAIFSQRPSMLATAPKAAS